MMIGLGFIHHAPNEYILGLTGLGESGVDQSKALLGPMPASDLQPGCGGSLDYQMWNLAAGIIGFPSELSGQSPADAMTQNAAYTCLSAANSAIFGCPPMPGCDGGPQQAAIAARYAAAITPAVQQYQQYGAYAPPSPGEPGYVPPSGGVTPTVPPYVPPVAPYQPPTPAPSVPAKPAASAAPSESSPSSGGTTSSSSGTPAMNFLTEASIGGIPNWVLIAGVVGVLFLFGGRR